ncbi:hypothetical protein STEG23_032837, partial [Scotinomys teguina]
LRFLTLKRENYKGMACATNPWDNPSHEQSADLNIGCRCVVSKQRYFIIALRHLLDLCDKLYNKVNLKKIYLDSEFKLKLIVVGKTQRQDHKAVVTMNLVKKQKTN